MSRREARTFKADQKRRRELRSGLVVRLECTEEALAEAHARIEAAHDVLDRWDALSKGESPTTEQIRTVLGPRPSQSPAGSDPSAAASAS